ncbi:MAG: hypothetical protein V4671_13000 [Armatimonadota bacterium]
MMPLSVMILSTLKGFAWMIGWVISLIGWLFFALVLYGVAEGMPGDPGRGLLFCAYWIVPGWLLLRFAAGLFPFGRRMCR